MAAYGGAAPCPVPTWRCRCRTQHVQRSTVYTVGTRNIHGNSSYGWHVRIGRSVGAAASLRRRCWDLESVCVAYGFLVFPALRRPCFVLTNFFGAGRSHCCRTSTGLECWRLRKKKIATHMLSSLRVEFTLLMIWALFGSLHVNALK